MTTCQMLLLACIVIVTTVAACHSSNHLLFAVDIGVSLASYFLAD